MLSVFMRAILPLGRRALEICELVTRVDVEECVRLVVEWHLDHGERCVPAVDLALAGSEEVPQRAVHAAAHEAEDRMGLLARARDRELGPLAFERRMQAR